MQIEELVDFHGEDRKQIDEVKKALEWVASKQEGLQALQNAKKLHGQKLNILVNEVDITDCGFIVHNGMPIIQVNPKNVLAAKYLDDNNTEHNSSLERFLAHEITHATQKNATEAAQEYLKIRSKYSDPSQINIPMKNYQNRLNAVKGNSESLEKIFSEIYDRHVRPQSEKMIERANKEIKNSDIAMEFITNYEVPAIEFENMMMKKYKNELGRTKDYANSAAFGDEAWEVSKKSFVNAATQSFIDSSSKQKSGR
ncbi:MAG: hypothetical protein R3D71_02255 [Rickettsiales bacterium]